ncbi:MAG: hypothetical protein MZV64_10495 [Ignavibacteriales bacterium]|nr:hypothetical protein [Ignavibacteriales bacterium]
MKEESPSKRVTVKLLSVKAQSGVRDEDERQGGMEGFLCAGRDLGDRFREGGLPPQEDLGRYQGTRPQPPHRDPARQDGGLRHQRIPEGPGERGQSTFRRAKV